MRTSIGIPGRKVGKKEVCDNDNILWDLLLDVDIESIQLRKGDVDPCFPAWKRGIENRLESFMEYESGG